MLCGVCHGTNPYLYRCIEQPKPNFLHQIYCTSILFAFHFMICSALLWPAQKYQWFQRWESQKHRNKSTSLYSSDSCMSIGNHCIEFLKKNPAIIFFSIFSSNECATSKTYTSVYFDLANEIVRFKNVLSYDRINVKKTILFKIILLATMYFSQAFKAFKTL